MTCGDKYSVNARGHVDFYHWMDAAFLQPLNPVNSRFRCV